MDILLKTAGNGKVSPLMSVLLHTRITYLRCLAGKGKRTEPSSGSAPSANSNNGKGRHNSNNSNHNYGNKKPRFNNSKENKPSS